MTVLYICTNEEEPRQSEMDGSDPRDPYSSSCSTSPLDHIIERSYRMSGRMWEATDELTVLHLQAFHCRKTRNTGNFDSS